MNYFPYIAMGLIAVLGYWYINNLTMSIRELESRNGALQNEIRLANETMQEMRRNYIQVMKLYSSYSKEIANMQAKVNTLTTALARDEKRLDNLAKEHPKLIENAVNRAVQKRLACITAAARGSKQVIIDGITQNCDT